MAGILGKDFSPTVTQRSPYRHATEEGGMRDGPKSFESVYSSVLDVPLNGFLMVLKRDLLNFLWSASVDITSIILSSAINNKWKNTFLLYYPF